MPNFPHSAAAAERLTALDIHPDCVVLLEVSDEVANERAGYFDGYADEDKQSAVLTQFRWAGRSLCVHFGVHR